jgi:hypothetical protein
VPGVRLADYSVDGGEQARADLLHRTSSHGVGRTGSASRP